MDIYDEWSSEKKFLNKKEPQRLFVSEREIWFVKLGKNIGFEQDGKENFSRPVLVLKRVGNLIFTVSLTSRAAKNKWFFELKNIHWKQKQRSEHTSVILSQVRILDKRRFVNIIGKIGLAEFLKVQDRVKGILF